MKHKLRQQKGVSFLYALLLFMAASVVAVLIVSSALSGVKRSAAEQEKNQRILTLESAARLIETEIQESDAVIIVNTETMQGFPVRETSYEAQGALHELVVDAIQSIDGGFYDFTADFTVHDDQGNLEDVNVHFRMNETYDISVLLETGGNLNGGLKLTMTCSMSTSGSEDEEGSYTTWLFWDSALISTVTGGAE